MRDYEELVRCLRGHSQKMGCADNCICEDADERGFGTCSEELAKLAADAIEKLQSYADLYKELTEKWKTVARKLIDAYPKWISVEERLPEQDGWYLVYAPWYSGGSSSGLRNVDGNMFSAFKNGKWSIEVGYHKRPDCVKAWLPLPEPPKEAPHEL